MRYAGNPPEDCAECATEDVSGFAVCKVNRLPCKKRKSQRLESELHFAILVLKDNGEENFWHFDQTNAADTNDNCQSSSKCLLEGAKRCLEQQYCSDGRIQCSGRQPSKTPSPEEPILFRELILRFFEG